MKRSERFDRHHEMRDTLDGAQELVAKAHADLVTLAKNAWAKMNDEDCDGELPTGVEPPKEADAQWFVTNALTLHWRLAAITENIARAEEARIAEEEQLFCERNGTAEPEETETVPQ